MKLYKVSFIAVVTHGLLPEEVESGEAILTNEPDDVDVMRETASFINTLTGKLKSMTINIESKEIEWGNE